MNERVLPEPRDLVLYVQFSSLQFYKLKVIGGGVAERFVNLLLECLVPFLELAKMRFNRHWACLLADCCLIGSSYTLTTRRKGTPFLSFRKSPLCTVSAQVSVHVSVHGAAGLSAIGQNAILHSHLPTGRPRILLG